MDDAIVLVAAVERLKRAWSDSGGVSAAIATVITKDGDRFAVASMGGEPMNALMDLNPGDVARFTGRLTLPIETMPTIKLSLVALIEGSGRVETWREQWFFVSTDRLSPDFHRRVAGLKLKGECAACGESIGTTDRIALILLRDGNACTVCADCGALPRDELVEKLDVAEGVESDPALFVTHAKMAECAIALSCGLDPGVVVESGTDDAWDYGLGGRFGLVREVRRDPDLRESASGKAAPSRRVGIAPPFPDAPMIARAERCIVLRVWVDPNAPDGFLRLDDSLRADVMGTKLRPE